MKARLLFLLVTGFLVGGAAGQQEKSDVDKLKGTWVATPEKGVSLIITFGDAKGTIQVKSVEKKKDESFTYKLDSGKTPKEMDITTDVGPRKGMISKAIYLLDGDSLTICFAGQPVEVAPNPEEPKDKKTKRHEIKRPAEFKAVDGQEVLIFKRQKL